MPITPFHLGPAMLVKAACPRWFSLGAFALVQIAIDVESVANILAGRYPIHDTLHTAAGALVVAVLIVPVARWSLPMLLRLLALGLSRVDGYPPSFRPHDRTRGWLALTVGAVVGALSHVALDATMHADVRPLGAGNPLYVPGSFVLVHIVCLAAGLVGVAAWFVRVRHGGHRAGAMSIEGV